MRWLVYHEHPHYAECQTASQYEVHVLWKTYVRFRWSNTKCLRQEWECIQVMLLCVFSVSSFVSFPFLSSVSLFNFCLPLLLCLFLSFFILPCFLLSSFICIADSSIIFYVVSSFFLLAHASLLGFICWCAAVECMVVLTAIIVSCSWYFGYARWWTLGETTIYCCDPISFDSRFRPRQGVSSVTLTWRCSAIMEAECGSQSSKVNISRYH